MSMANYFTIVDSKQKVNHCRRFSPLRRSRKYSTGAIYLSIVNNPRAIRFLSEETILFSALPGPHEPTVEQLNNVLEILVEKVLRLYRGTSFQNPASA